MTYCQACSYFNQYLSIEMNQEGRLSPVCQEVHMSSIIVPISSPTKFGIDHCCYFILVNDDSKAAWLLYSLVISYLSNANISVYFLLADIGELQK